ncbi:Pogo transposable element-like 5, partial [Homarus americanus]
AKQRRYEACFKLKVVAYGKSRNNCAAARKCGVTEKMEHLLRSMPRKKCAMRRGTALWPNLEKHAVDMVREQRQNGYVVSRNKICIWALKWAKANQEHIKDFKATALWCRQNKNTVAQKLPADLDCKITNFHRYVIQQRKTHGYPLSNIGKMDETPISFDMVGNHTIDTKGTKTVGKQCQKIKFLAGIFVHVNEKGWMANQRIKLWIDHVWCKLSGGFRKQRSLLVWDMFTSHLTKGTKTSMARNSNDIVVIPGGLTSVVQPLDVCEQWNEWTIRGKKSCTKGGNMCAPELDVLCDFVVKAWNDIIVEAVIKSFKRMKCCGRMRMKQKPRHLIQSLILMMIQQ